MRQNANADVRAAICARTAVGDHHREFRCGLVLAAEASGNPSVAFSVPGVALAGPRERAVRLDAAGRSFACLGVFRVAEDPEEEAGSSEDQKLGKPQDFDIRACRRVCTDSALVDTGGATVR